MGSSNAPTKVLWLAKGLGPGGMERLLVNHATFGDRERFEYHVAYLVDRPHSLVAELEAHGVPCVRLGRGSGSDPRWLSELVSLVRSRGIDIVHSHSPLPAAMARPVLKALPKRPHIVYTEHNTWDCYGRATRLANLLTYPLDDAQFAVSAPAAASPPSRLARNVEVLIHGIDIEQVRGSRRQRAAKRQELGVDEDTVVVSTVANLRREKGYDVLLDAARSVLAESDNLLFCSIGQGPLHQELLRHHRNLGLGDRFRFLGFRDDVLGFLAASDVFALASRQEGLPVAFMEATALGLPVVATSVGGLPQAMEHEGSGLLVPPERPDLLAAALTRVVRDPDLRSRLAAGSKQMAERFDGRDAVARQEAVYAELMA